MEPILIGDCEILVGHGLPRPLLPESVIRRRAVVITQPGAETVAQEIGEQLSTEGLDVFTHTLPDREEAKSLEAVSAVYAALAEHELGRGDTVIGVGGGAVTDAAGFIAGTWMRGVELVLVPTTLLGAVDASIGGKTAVNFAGKNLVGVFWPARRVAVDLSILEALPPELKREGAAEVIKAGFLAVPEIVDAYGRHGVDTPLEEVVGAAIRVKADIVSRDLTEQGDRALLNLGHTIGHAVEFASGISHGEAVAIGLVAAAAVSEARLGFRHSDLVRSTLQTTGLPTKSPPVPRDQLLELVGRDKKRLAGTVRMVLLEDVGKPHLLDVGPDDIQLGMDAIGL
ncbi:MAG TPA: 3-dehydroquinate synthase family protein [Acidimicrobiia bacterium]|nr:3-dehydroquinate synthase family protein [Acidimicrobiia bacterium]